MDKIGSWSVFIFVLFLSLSIPPFLSNPDVKSILGGWNLEFEKSLLTFGGRTIPPEKIHQRGGSVSHW